MKHTIIRQDEDRGELFVQLHIDDDTETYQYAQWIQGPAYQQWIADERSPKTLNAIIEGMLPAAKTLHEREKKMLEVQGLQEELETVRTELTQTKTTLKAKEDELADFKRQSLLEPEDSPTKK
jgi:hypothetical protein